MLVALLSERIGVRAQIALAISAFVTGRDNRSRDGQALPKAYRKAEESISLTGAPILESCIFSNASGRRDLSRLTV
jgi:hypothetical protein